MAKKYLTAPDPNQKGWPGGVPYIIGNEGCERFSYYGMRSILQVHLTSLFVAAAYAQTQAQEHAQEMVHLFMAAVYAFPMIGAIIADRLLGKYHTIIWVSMIYCLGHAVLSLFESTIWGMGVGLALIAVGSGGIKPCVSAHVGDQFGKSNWHLVDKIFQAFYWIINFGSFFSTLLIPWIYNWEKQNLNWGVTIGGHHYTTSLAFGLPGILMFIATVVFWMGRHKFVHVPANPGGKLGLLDTLSSVLLFMGLIGLPMFFMDILSPGAFWAVAMASTVVGLALFNYRQKLQQDDGFLAILFYSIKATLSGENQKAVASAKSAGDDSIKKHWLFAAAAKKFDETTAEGPRAVIRIAIVFFLVSVFWALFDQHASSWIRQAQMMELHVGFLGMNFNLLPSQISALNPIMVMALIPFNMAFFYPLMNKFTNFTALKKMAFGMFIASAAFVAVAILQGAIDAGVANGTKVHVLWQFFPYLVMTQSEVMVSITGLAFAYTQAPKRMKSTIMGFWLLTVAFGNKLVAIITKLPEMSLDKFFWTFAVIMGLAAVGFSLLASRYKYKEYTQ